MLLMSAELLDRLLSEIKTCLDDELCDRFGIGENYDILLKGNFDRIARDIYNSGKWTYNPEMTSLSGLHEIGPHRFFSYTDGVVLLQALSWPMPIYADIAEKDGYNCSFTMVGTGASDNATNLDDGRVFANAVCDLIRYVKDRRIPAYFARSEEH